MIKCDLEKLSGTIPKLSSASMNQNVNVQFREFNDRERRRKNVILYGMSESGDATATKLSDEQKIRNLLHSLQITCNEFSAYRLRSRLRTSQRPCPVKIEFKDLTTPSSLMSKFYAPDSYVKSVDDWKSVTVSRDLTKVQQEERKLKQDELRQRRGNGENVKMSLVNGSHVITAVTQSSGSGNADMETH